MIIERVASVNLHPPPRNELSSVFGFQDDISSNTELDALPSPSSLSLPDVDWSHAPFRGDESRASALAKPPLRSKQLAAEKER